MLIKCPECGKDVSSTCHYCIHCGYDLSSLPHIDNPLPDASPTLPIAEDERPIFDKDQLTVLGCRGPAGGGLKTLTIIGFILSIGFIAFFGSVTFYFAAQCFKYNDWSNLILAFLFSHFLGFGVYLMIEAIICWHRMYLNGINKKPLIYQKAGDESLILVALNGAEFQVKPSSLMDVRRGLTSDFLVVARFFDVNGNIRKVYLGWTTNFFEVTQNIGKIKR